MPLIELDKINPYTSSEVVFLYNAKLNTLNISSGQYSTKVHIKKSPGFSLKLRDRNNDRTCYFRFFGGQLASCCENGSYTLLGESVKIIVQDQFLPYDFDMLQPDLDSQMFNYVADVARNLQGIIKETYDKGLQMTQQELQNQILDLETKLAESKAAREVVQDELRLSEEKLVELQQQVSGLQTAVTDLESSRQLREELVQLLNHLRSLGKWL